MWGKLRNRQMDGWKFKRQVPFKRFVLDFFCFEARLAIEIDGGTRSDTEAMESDRDRTLFLNDNGVRVLRFQSTEVSQNINGVLEVIHAELGQQSAPSSGAPRRPLPEGRGDIAAEAR